MEKYICIHGHFYQPPRENAWLEQIELQDSAYPFHDWNDRVTYECYTPNTASRILDESNVIKDIVNNYANISYNFGPTLLSWLEEKVPETYQNIISADEISSANFSGHGSAISQAYNHMILPLANARDISTQVKWGIRDFEYRFKRKPEGMWLPETAVNVVTLEVLAENEIKFTVLAPRQAEKTKKQGENEWIDVRGGKVDPRRPYLCNLPSGHTICIFFYDGNISKDVAFNKLLNNGKNFADYLLKSLDENPRDPQIAHIATDGESYGHHHSHGDMALAYCVDYIQTASDASITNYGEFLEKYPPDHEVIIVDDSSWSCEHGVERWRNNCGCNTGDQPGWNQHWRKPLRDSLDWLRDRMIEIYEQVGAKLFNEPWQARDAYIEVILNRNEKTIESFLEKYGNGLMSNGTKSRAMRMLEMQRNAMLMYTSCGWFFSEVSGIETVQILQYACRALQLASQVAGSKLEEQFIHKLEECKSNIPEYDTAADIYRKRIIPARLDLMRVGMHYAVASLFEKQPHKFPVFNYSTQSEFFERREAGIQRISYGRINIRSKTTFSEKHFSFIALYLGQHNIIGYISVDMKKDTFYSMYDQTLAAFRESNLSKLLGLMQEHFGGEKFSIWHLFKDEKRKVFDKIVAKYLSKIDKKFKQIYEQDYQLINALANEKYPVPEIYLHTFAYVFNAELKECLQTDPLDTNLLKTIVFKFEKWDLKLSAQIPFERIVNDMINKNLMELYLGADGFTRLKNLNYVFDILKDFGLKLNLYQSQNLYFKISKGKQADSWEKKWEKEFNNLGRNLGIKVEID